MAIQPGVGYTFTASSQGENINVIQPWTQWMTVGSTDYNVRPQQFEVRQLAGTPDNVCAIQIAKGAVNFDQSEMPIIFESPATSRRQIVMQKVAVVSSGITSNDGGLDPLTTLWMNNGGSYTIASDGFYYITICKFDINGGEAGGITDSNLIKTNRPFVSIFKTEDDMYETIFSQTGPSQYVQTLNMSPMEGYDKTTTNLTYDFNFGHSTWFNPVKYGYDCKIIATAEVYSEEIEIDGQTKTVKRANIRQHVVGSINMNIPLQLLGIQMKNVEDLKQSDDDPYNIQEEEGFDKIVNKDLRVSMNALTPLTTTFFYDMISPVDWTTHFYKFEGKIEEATCVHPFHLKRKVTGEVITFKLCTGMVNNMIPDNMDTTIELTTGYVYISCGVSGENYPYTVHIYQGSTVPADTESASYIAIARIVDSVAEQLVSSSLWTERFKCGGDPAKYWWSNV